MTLLIAATCDTGIVIASDAALSNEEERVILPTSKWERVAAGWYVGHCGSDAHISRILNDFNTSGSLRDSILTVGDSHGKEGALDAGFLSASLRSGIVYYEGDGGVIGPFPNYFAAGSGGSQAMCALDTLYRRVRNKTRAAVTKVVLETMRTVERYNPTVYRPFYVDFVARLESV